VEGRVGGKLDIYGKYGYGIKKWLGKRDFLGLKKAAMLIYSDSSSRS